LSLGVLAAAGLALLVYLERPGAPTPTAPAASAPPRPRIALVMKTLTSPFFVEMEKGARRAEAELGVELLVKTAAQETSIEQQIAIVDQLTRAKVDAIVIAPGDSYRLIPGLKKARAAGIVVVNIDNRLDAELAREHGLADVPFISVDNETAVYQAVKAVSAELREPTEAALIEGIRSAANAQARKQGALRALAENPRVHVVASESANWKIDDAYEVARKLFAAHPRIKLLYCANDMMALGAIRYLQESGTRSVTVIGHDALEEGRQAMRGGWLAASVDQQSGQQGYMGVVYAARLLKGEPVPAETMLPTQLVTAKSLARTGK
jgi:ribose transport system substrate-binding protein